MAHSNTLRSNSRSIFIMLLIGTVVCVSAFNTVDVPQQRAAAVTSEFVNFETGHVHPLDRTPDGTKLLAVNTGNNSLEVFDITGDVLLNTASIPVGLDPVTVRVLNNNTAWVVNQVSDEISIVDLTLNVVIRSLRTENEPADVVFAGSPQKAFVSCAERESIQIFDLSNLDVAPQEVLLVGEQPKAMAVSPDGNTVYTAFFESGNQTTVVSGNTFIANGICSEQQSGNACTTVANDVTNPNGPYAGAFPVYNNGTSYTPAWNPANAALTSSQSLVVRKNGSNQWMDDNGGNWTSVVSGGLGQRLLGWDMPDRDVAVLNANSLALSYQQHLGNILMAIGVNPVTGKVAVVGTDATNEVRFEPNLNGVFLRVNVSQFTTGSASTITDLNSHLDYLTSSVAISEREKSIGDPRGIAYTADGQKAYVTGMGSNNVVVINSTGARANPQPIEVGQGPTGIVLDEARNKAYVLNKFGGSVSTIDLVNEEEIGRANFYDPTPEVIKKGRPHLYDTHKSSGLGHISCGSCHVDARWDRLAWDLGDPAADMIDVDGKLFHPMKGLKTTQFLIDIIGKAEGNLHWRGDKGGFADFASAFQHLQGLSAPADAQLMQEFSDFLDACWYVPNPYRTYRPEVSAANATQRINPNRVRGAGTTFQTVQNAGVRLFVAVNLNCSHCHQHSTGRGNLPGEGTVGGTPNIPMAGNENMAPDLRSVYRKLGFYYDATEVTSGFGYMADGVFPTKFNESGTSDYFGDYEAELLSWSGGITQVNSPTSHTFPLVHTSQDAMPAVGLRHTINGVIGSTTEITTMKTLVNDFPGDLGMIVKGIYNNEHRGFYYTGSDQYQSDKAGQTVTHAQLIASAQAGQALSWTIVHEQTDTRMGVDADSDALLDNDDHDAMVNVRAYLQGPFDGTMMRSDLLTNNVLPATDPYGYGVTASAELLARSGPLAPVDWVEVELRSNADATLILDSQAGLVLRNGAIVSPKGEQTLNFAPTQAGDHHVAVRHRNHLGVMSFAPITIQNMDTYVDFTNVGTATYGIEAQKQSAGKTMMWLGDVQGDGLMKYTGPDNDRDPILQIIGGSIPTNAVQGYYPEDMNLDGTVKYTGLDNDRDPILQNIGGSIPTAVRVEQLP